MSLYPSLEDMKVDQVLRQEAAATAPPASSIATAYMASYYTMPNTESSSLQAMYPHLNDYMGLDLTSDELSLLYEQEAGLEAMRKVQQTAMEPIGGTGGSSMIAPLSGQTSAYARAQITHGIRELVLCKDSQDRIGLRVKAMHGGIFVVLVTEKSPAALSGLRFGDQLLQIDGKDVAGSSMDQVHKRLRNAKSDRITIVVRDRPFERTITMHKDQGGVAGFLVRDGKVESVVAGSSAARNGLLTDHYLIEVNGANVVGLSDRSICELIRNSDSVIIITVMPSRVFEHMMQKMSFSLVKKLMDHGVHDI